MLLRNVWYIGAWGDELGEQGLVDIASDANRMHMRRMVERLIVSEQSAVAVK
jgi:hypothetical protein